MNRTHAFQYIIVTLRRFDYENRQLKMKLADLKIRFFSSLAAAKQTLVI